MFIFCNTTKKVAGATVSKAECVIDVNSGRILYEYNSHQALPIASTTKILTAICAIENSDITSEYTITEKSVGIEGSSIYLRAGEKLTIEEMLYGLMLRSGNDCAESLALAVSGSIENFIKLMNDTAKRIGANESNFINPHGLHDVNHKCSAYDLAKITAYAMKNKTFRKIVSTKRKTISNDGFEYDRVLLNKNKMLNLYPNCTGIKTGYTKKAGRCLVSGANNNGLDLACVVINSPDMYNRSTELLNDCFNYYTVTKILDSSEQNENIFKNNNGKNVKFLGDYTFSYPLTCEEKQNLTVKYNGLNFEEFLNNPKNEANIEVFIKNQLIFSKKIYTIIW